MGSSDWNTVEEREYDRQQAAAEQAWELNRPEREQDAMDAIQEPDELKTLLEDEWLIYPLARQQANIERAVKEVTKLQTDHRVPDDALISIRAILQATLQLQRQLFTRKIEEIEEAL